jgi:hypothetical protein
VKWLNSKWGKIYAKLGKKYLPSNQKAEMHDGKYELKPLSDNGDSNKKPEHKRSRVVSEVCSINLLNFAAYKAIFNPLISTRLSEQATPLGT